MKKVKLFLWVVLGLCLMSLYGCLTPEGHRLGQSLLLDHVRTSVIRDAKNRVDKSYGKGQPQTVIIQQQPNVEHQQRYYNGKMLDGGHYKGGLLNGAPYGFGSYTWKSGDKYVGEFRAGKKNGQGTYTWPDGRRYVGEYRGGKENGQGTYTWPDGRRYVGEFRDGKMYRQRSSP